MRKIDGRKLVLSVGTLVFGLVKVVGGLQVIWSNWGNRKPGTFLGLGWPHNWHAVLSDLEVFCLLFGAVWLIRDGIFGRGQECEENVPLKSNE
jgi:hypothetical protein